ncbi:hypothetical protein [Streptococcus suis]|uniref:hypothetical protein n=1 Tax=Streptococcus suis TaxID=1307 RepID=UPI003BA24823
MLWEKKNCCIANDDYRLTISVGIGNPNEETIVKLDGSNRSYQIIFGFIHELFWDSTTNVNYKTFTDKDSDCFVEITNSKLIHELEKISSGMTVDENLRHFKIKGLNATIDIITAETFIISELTKDTYSDITSDSKIALNEPIERGYYYLGCRVEVENSLSFTLESNKNTYEIDFANANSINVISETYDLLPRIPTNSAQVLGGQKGYVFTIKENGSILGYKILGLENYNAYVFTESCPEIYSIQSNTN